MQILQEQFFSSFKSKYFALFFKVSFLSLQLFHVFCSFHFFGFYIFVLVNKLGSNFLSSYCVVLSKQSKLAWQFITNNFFYNMTYFLFFINSPQVGMFFILVLTKKCQLLDFFESRIDLSI